jgi:MHS family citrate/tricarballylate:H+ symporter-like MFS transporter
LWLSFLYGSYNGAMVVALTEIVPANVRTTGFSLAPGSARSRRPG